MDHVGIVIHTHIGFCVAASGTTLPLEAQEEFAKAVIDAGQY